MAYHHQSFRPLTFHDARMRFLAGNDTPRDYLERCLATIEEKEPVVKAWASLRIEGARAEADAATQRYRDGAPLSAIDGMPIGVKDLIATRELPTTMGIANNEQAVTLDDSASIQAMKKAGGILLGKAVTTELGGGWPSPTTNPFAIERTPGGSSSGSAAAIASAMVPVALGTQVGGSILRPAAYCGNIAIKPTMGAIHRGERLGLSQACIGVHAGAIDDLWATMVEIASRSGGDPGYPGLYGTLPPPPPLRPARLAIMEGPGWAITEPGARALFDDLLDRLSNKGVDLVRASANPALAAFEQALPDAMQALGVILAFENRSLLANLMVRMPDKLTPSTLAQYQQGLTLTLEDYRQALEKRETLRQAQAALRDSTDAILSLSTPAVAPIIGSDPVMLTGNPIYNIIPSLLGAPALTLPLLTLDDMPLGVQLMGQWHEDQKLVAMGAWMMAELIG